MGTVNTALILSINCQLLTLLVTDSAGGRVGFGFLDSS